MRTIARVDHPTMLITVFLWNNKYLIKFESGPYEQTFKVDEMLIENPTEFKKILTEEFLHDVQQRFMEMNNQFNELLQNLR